ncbi:MAG: asparagine synthase [Pseudomonadota bacterium]|jgi:asparagine synthase (glutamine-hydrolysing)
MCGFVGLAGGVDAEALREALDAIRHRGPDDSGLFVDAGRGIALGHVRLSILDPTPAGHQPMSDADGMVTLAYNGEIYNFIELRGTLRERGHVFTGDSDTEVLLRLYLEHGETMLPMLNGIFAFALWDARDGSVLLARDGLGVKPLYVAETPSGVAFGSELKGVRRLARLETDLDADAVLRYLGFLHAPGTGTPLRAITRLAPGESVRIRDGRIERRHTWYTLPLMRRQASGLGAAEAVAETGRLLRQAVRRQLVSDAPVGAFLSGGLDSSSIVAFAREAQPDIRCFTIDTRALRDPGAPDDLPYAVAVAKHLGVSLETVVVESSTMAADLERMISQLDEPIADPAALHVFHISRAAREQGIKVLLSGAGGDDVFTGYRRHRALGLERMWTWLPATQRRWLASAASSFGTSTALSRRLAKLATSMPLTGDDRLVQYFLWDDATHLSSLLSADFRARVSETALRGPMLDYLRGFDRPAEPLERMLALEQRFFLADHNLLYTDRMSMAAGVEVRVPFLDPDLMEFAAGLSMRLLQHGRTGKWVLKEAMTPFLPSDVVHRPKTGFGAPLRRWMREDLREMAADLLSEPSVRSRGIFDPATTRRMFQELDAGTRDTAYTLFSMLCIELWCRRFVDR